MPDTFDHIAYLTQEIGARPAGSQNEQQAALYIADTLQQESGLRADVEDFRAKSDGLTIRLILALVDLLVVVLAILFPVLAVPAIAVTLLLGVALLLEYLNKLNLGDVLPGKESQNIVVKYIPENSKRKSRKIILVANYDSGKCRMDLKPGFLRIKPLLNRVALVAGLLLPIVMIVRGIFFLNTTGAISLVINIVAIVLVVLVLIPRLLTFISRFAKASEGANCNASGVAVLMEAATRAGNGSFSGASLSGYDDDFNGSPVIHGKGAAYEAGLIPEGAEIEYEYDGDRESSGWNVATIGAAAGAAMGAAAASAQAAQPVDENSPEGRLLAAKQAIAALTGKPTSMTIAYDFGASHDSEEPQAEEAAEDLSANNQDAQAIAESGQLIEASVAAIDETPSDGEQTVALEAAAPEEKTSSVPDWFKRAQAKARKSTDEEEAPIQRSRFADALDAAAAVSATSVADAAMAQEEQEAPKSELDYQLEAMRNSINQDAEKGLDRVAQNADELEENAQAVEAAAAASAAALAEAEAVQEIDTPETQAAEAAASDQVPENAAEPQIAFDGADEDVFDENDALGETVAMPALDLQSGIPALQAIKPVVLPDVPLDQALPSIESILQQPAPLAQTGVQTQSALNDEQAQPAPRGALLAALPTFDGASDQNAQRFADPMQTTPGVVAPIEQGNVIAFPTNIGEVTMGAPVLDASSFPAFDNYGGNYGGTAGMTGSFAPVGNQLVMNAQGEDMYIDDADDSVYNAEFTDQGAYAGEDYVEMPKKKGIFSKLFKKKDKKQTGTESSAQEWLNVGEDYTANSAGASRGGWESFQPDDMGYQDVYQEGYQDGYYQDAYQDGPQNAYNQDGYQEGAYQDGYYQESAGAYPGAYPGNNGYYEQNGAFQAYDAAYGAPYQDGQVMGAAPDQYYNAGGYDAQMPYGAPMGQTTPDNAAFANNGYAGENNPNDAYQNQAGFGVDYPNQEYPSTAYGEDVYQNNAPLASMPEINLPEINLPQNGEAAGQTFNSGNPNDFNGFDENLDFIVPGEGGSQKPWNNRGWNGGAFSGLKQKMGKGARRSKKASKFENESYQYEDEYDEYGAYNEAGDVSYRGYAAEGSDAYDTYEEDGYEHSSARRSVQARGSIRDFRTLDLDTEVWFVALGSQYAGNAGMKAFLKEHERDLRGAVVVEIEGVGAGDLAYVKREGAKLPIEAPRRAVRFLDKAQEITGTALFSQDLLWRESAASLATRKGINGLHLIGSLNGKPAYCGEAIDTINNIDEDVLASNTDFIMELLKTM